MTKFEITNVQLRTARGSFVRMHEDFEIECDNTDDAVVAHVEAFTGFPSVSFTWQEVGA